MCPLGSPLALSAAPRNPNEHGGSGEVAPTQEVRLSAGSVAGVANRMSERDWQVLRLVSRCRAMSGAQLGELYWPEGARQTRARLARRGLARLAHLEVLAPLGRRVGGVRAGSDGRVFAVGRVGQRLLTGEVSSRRVRPAYTPGERYLAHTLAVAQLYIDLVVAQRWKLAEVLAFEPEPECWRHYVATFGVRKTLKPDAFVRLGIGEYEDSWFLERDMGTVSLVTIERQAQRYLECYRAGTLQAERGVFPRTAWIVPDAARAAMVGQALRRLPDEAQKLFAVTTTSEAVPLLTAGAAS